MRSDQINCRYKIVHSKEEAKQLIDNYFTQFREAKITPEVIIIMSRLDRWVTVDDPIQGILRLAGVQHRRLLLDEHLDGGLTERPERLQYNITVPIRSLPPQALATLRDIPPELLGGNPFVDRIFQEVNDDE